MRGKVKVGWSRLHGLMDVHYAFTLLSGFRVPFPEVLLRANVPRSARHLIHNSHCFLSLIWCIVKCRKEQLANHGHCWIKNANNRISKNLTQTVRVYCLQIKLGLIYAFAIDSSSLCNAIKSASIMAYLLRWFAHVQLCIVCGLVSLNTW